MNFWENFGQQSYDKLRSIVENAGSPEIREISNHLRRLTSPPDHCNVLVQPPAVVHQNNNWSMVRYTAEKFELYKAGKNFVRDLAEWLDNGMPNDTVTPAVTVFIKLVCSTPNPTKLNIERIFELKYLKHPYSEETNVRHLQCEQYGRFACPGAVRHNLDRWHQNSNIDDERVLDDDGYV